MMLTGEILAPNTEIRGKKRKKNSFSPFYSFRGHLRYMLEPDGYNNRYKIRMIKYKISFFQIILWKVELLGE